MPDTRGTYSKNYPNAPSVTGGGQVPTGTAIGAITEVGGTPTVPALLYAIAVPPVSTTIGAGTSQPNATSATVPLAVDANGAMHLADGRQIVELLAQIAAGRTGRYP